MKILYFNKSVTSNSLSFSLYGGEASKNWLAEISEGKRVNNAMKKVSADFIRESIYDTLRNIESENEKYRYWISSLYIEPKQVMIMDDATNKCYLIDYSLEENNTVVLAWDTKVEMVRCYLPVDEVKEDTMLFKAKEVLSINEDGQLISNTHRLSSVDSAVARKAEILLNSWEKEDTEMDKEKDLEKEDKKVDIQIESKEKEKKEDSEASDETSSEAEWSDFYVC